MVAPFLVLSTTLLAIPIVLLSFAGAPDFASRVFARLWARLNAAVSLMDVETRGSDHLKPGQSYVIVANHQSLVDIYVLYGFLGVDIKWVMKQELRSVPVLGYTCDAMGHIYIDRSNTESALASINSARSRINNDVSVVFFPEGTRSRGSELGEFKRGAFRFAIDMGLPVLPVAIHDTRHVLPSGTTELAPGQVRLEILEPIPTAGLEAEDARGLATRAREMIDKSLHPDASEGI